MAGKRVSRKYGRSRLDFLESTSNNRPTGGRIRVWAWKFDPPDSVCRDSDDTEPRIPDPLLIFPLHMNCRRNSVSLCGAPSQCSRSCQEVFHPPSTVVRALFPPTDVETDCLEPVTRPATSIRAWRIPSTKSMSPPSADRESKTLGRGPMNATPYPLSGNRAIGQSDSRTLPYRCSRNDAPVAQHARSKGCVSGGASVALPVGRLRGEPVITKGNEVVMSRQGRNVAMARCASVLEASWELGSPLPTALIHGQLARGGVVDGGGDLTDHAEKKGELRRGWRLEDHEQGRGPVANRMCRAESGRATAQMTEKLLHPHRSTTLRRGLCLLSGGHLRRSLDLSRHPWWKDAVRYWTCCADPMMSIFEDTAFTNRSKQSYPYAASHGHYLPAAVRRT